MARLKSNNLVISCHYFARDAKRVRYRVPAEVALIIKGCYKATAPIGNVKLPGLGMYIKSTHLTKFARSFARALSNGSLQVALLIKHLNIQVTVI